MEKELKAKWIEKLRSSEYKQGRMFLRTCENSYCCLGVLCDILYPDRWIKERGNYMIANNITCLPGSIGVKQDLIRWENDLIDMNDSGISFNEIADFIEREVPGE